MDMIRQFLMPKNSENGQGWYVNKYGILTTLTH